jgi:hypothetical protein
MVDWILTKPRNRINHDSWLTDRLRTSINHPLSLSLNKGKLPEALKIVINNSISQTQTQSRQLELVGNGTFMDEFDLKVKYQQKPGYAEKIMQRTHSFKHILTDAMMFEDMEYKTIATQSSKREHYMDFHGDLDCLFMVF